MPDIVATKTPKSYYKPLGGDYYLDPTHWANKFFPAYEVNGKSRHSDSERKLILAFLDQFNHLLPYLIEAEIELYSERSFYPSCLDLIAMFKEM